MAETLSDPTRPPPGLDLDMSKASSGVESMPRVSGTRIGHGSRVAMLNGRPAQVGDVIDGYEVVAIDAGQVKLSRNGVEVGLPLLPNIKKEKHKGR